MLYLAATLGVPKSEGLTQVANLRSNFSVSRRIIRLGHVVHPLATVVDLLRDLRKHPDEIQKLEKPKSGEDFARLFAIFQVFLALANDIADDLGTLASIGVLPPSFGIADYYGVRFWATGNLIDQFETYETIIRLQTRVYMLREAGEEERAKRVSSELSMVRVLQAQLFA
ncbi:hypothetical protein HDU93_006317, partial [Gonapodya sp. JEL0774]